MKRKIVWGILYTSCLIIALGLCSCTTEERLHPTSSAAVSEGQTSSIAVTSSEPRQGGDTDTFRRKVNEYLDFDADVFIPSQTKYGLYRTSLLKFDTNKAKEAFWGNTEVSVEKPYSDSIYFIDAATGKGVYINDNNLNYTTRSLYTSLVNLNLGNKDWNNNSAYLNRDLSFMSREKAVTLLNEKLGLFTSLKINAISADIYSFTNENLREINDVAISSYQERLKTAEAQGLKDRIQSELQVRSVYKTELEKDESKQCYYIMAKLTYDMVPIYNSIVNFDALPSSVDESSTLLPPSFVGIISDDGIESFTLSNNIQVEEPLSTYEYSNLIPLEKAIELFENKYSQIVAKTTVKSISLSYLYKPVDFSKEHRDDYVLAPVWIFEGRQTPVDADATDTFPPREQFTAFIDAVSGEEIV